MSTDTSGRVEHGVARPGLAGVPDLIHEAAFHASMAAAGADSLGKDRTEVPTEVVHWITAWLYEAAARERQYRRDNPDWTPAEPWEEAWTAGILAAKWLDRDPAVYDLALPDEEP